MTNKVEVRDQLDALVSVGDSTGGTLVQFKENIYIVMACKMEDVAAVNLATGGWIGKDTKVKVLTRGTKVNITANGGC